MQESGSTPYRRILGIAYHFRPMNSMGAKRTERFAKYLPACGYQLSLVTTRAFGSCADDAARGVTRAFDPAGYTKKAVLGGVSDVASMRRRSSLDRAKRIVIAAVRSLAVPDPENIWFPFALRAALSVLREGGWSALYSTSSPETDHLIAAALKWRTGLPWIADFRDGWMFEPPRSARRTVRWRRWVESRMESAVVRMADRIVAVNEVNAADLERRFPDQAHKVTVITNGFDPDDFGAITAPSATSGFCLMHAGRLSGSRGGTSIDGFIGAVEQLRLHYSAVYSDLRVVMIGGLLPEESHVIAHSSVADRFELRAPVPYHASIQAQREASVLLLVIAPETQGVVPGKVFEYLASGRPILVLAGRSPAVDVVRELEAGVAVDPRDVDGIVQTLVQLHAAWKDGRLRGASADAVARFDARNLAGRLGAVFDEAIDEAAVSHSGLRA